jgi:selenocysteine lyase/cysteine desulfurase
MRTSAGTPVLVDAAQLAPHRPLPPGADFLAFSGHKLYAPYGAGALIGPQAAFADGDPFLVGGGAVDLVDLGEVVWTRPPDREEAGSPNVLGAIALAAATTELQQIGWDAVARHDAALAIQLRAGLASIPACACSAPVSIPTRSRSRPSWSKGFPTRSSPPASAPSSPSACVTAASAPTPYLIRLLGLSGDDLDRFRAAARHHDRRSLPGAVRASTGLSTTTTDIERLLEAVAAVATNTPPVEYLPDPLTGDYWPQRPPASRRRARPDHRLRPRIDGLSVAMEQERTLRPLSLE